jgi:hypothetical protein
VRRRPWQTRLVRFAKLWILGPRPKLGRTAVYDLIGQRERWLYVGMTNWPRKRWEQHQATKPWAREVVRIRVRWYPLRAIAWAVEWATIARRRPLYNRDRNYNNPARVVYRDLPARR